jgi:hypothetical protein
MEYWEMETHVKVAVPWATVDGKTISAWTQDWMKWVFHAPDATPVGTPFGSEDTSGNANVHNDGPVFFLFGGDWGGDPAHVPTINVPAGKDVLIPMINAFDIESGDPNLSTIPNWVQKTHLSYADEARFITTVANLSIYDAHLTLTKVGQSTPIINLQWPQTQVYNENTGIFALGNPQANPLDYLGSLLTGLSFDQHNVPFTEEVGRWAMLTGLGKGDYVLNFGGGGHAFYNPFDHTQQILGTGGNDWVHNTTDRLHVA